MAVDLRTGPPPPPTNQAIAFRAVAMAVLLVAAAFSVGRLCMWTYEQVQDELSRPPQEVETGFRVGGTTGIGTTERSLFAALALQGIVAREGVGSSAAARSEQVEASLRYADLLLELQRKEVGP